VDERERYGRRDAEKKVSFKSIQTVKTLHCADKTYLAVVYIFGLLLIKQILVNAVGFFGRRFFSVSFICLFLFLCCVADCNDYWSAFNCTHILACLISPQLALPHVGTKVADYVCSIATVVIWPTTCKVYDACLSIRNDLMTVANAITVCFFLFTLPA